MLHLEQPLPQYPESALSVERYSPSAKDIWDDFVWSSQNGTMSSGQKSGDFDVRLLQSRDRSGGGARAVHRAGPAAHRRRAGHPLEVRAVRPCSASNDAARTCGRSPSSSSAHCVTGSPTARELRDGRGGPADHEGRGVPAPHQPRRAAPAVQRARRHDEPGRTTAAGRVGEPAGVEEPPRALRGRARNHRPVPGRRAQLRGFRRAARLGRGLREAAQLEA